MEKKKLAERLKAGVVKNKQQNEVIKTSNVETAPSPIEKANALRKKESNQYTSYIASKLLPGIK